jgi:hypothetical protein
MRKRARREHRKDRNVDGDTLYGLVTSLGCLASICVSLGVFVALAVGMVLLIRRQWQPKDEAALSAERDRMRADVSRDAVGLRPWSADALTDLSTDWDATWALALAILQVAFYNVLETVWSG